MCFAFLRAWLEVWIPSSPRRLFHPGSALGGCRHTRELAKANSAWACSGTSGAVSGFAPGRQGLPLLGLHRGKRQSLQEGWQPTGWWGGLVLQHTEVTTPVKDEKLGQLLRPLTRLPGVVCAAVWRCRVPYSAGCKLQADKASRAPRKPYLQLLGRWRALSPYSVCSCRRGEGSPKFCLFSSSQLSTLTPKTSAPTALSLSKIQPREVLLCKSDPQSQWAMSLFKEMRCSQDLVRSDQQFIRSVTFYS